MSNSVRPHRRQPTRLRRPWDSPGKNTGVGCHFLLQCSKVKSESEVAESCPTLSDLMDCSLPGSSVHEIFQARVLEWGANAFSRALARDRFLMLFLLTQMLIISVLKHFRWSFFNFLSKIGFLCHSGTICTILQGCGHREPTVCPASMITVWGHQAPIGQSHARTPVIALPLSPLQAPPTFSLQTPGRQTKEISLVWGFCLHFRCLFSQVLK